MKNLFWLIIAALIIYGCNEAGLIKINSLGDVTKNISVNNSGDSFSSKLKAFNDNFYKNSTKKISGNPIKKIRKAAMGSADEEFTGDMYQLINSSGERDYSTGISYKNKSAYNHVISLDIVATKESGFIPFDFGTILPKDISRENVDKAEYHVKIDCKKKKAINSNLKVYDKKANLLKFVEYEFDEYTYDPKTVKKNFCY